ncbi:hypothetical protein C2G38_2136865 [Gigaspora rosea]|uniref:Uncharacterized protein n=1 Tax=Gigaspora rosea TaxID=44941 RepID=A0A397WA43_9GLOM|nr:hypothetical protein C2G38_2136865 [Gigaspora rosea]
MNQTYVRIQKKNCIGIDLNQKYVRIQKKYHIANEIIKINGVIKNLKTICEILEGTVGLNNVSLTIKDEGTIGLNNVTRQSEKMNFRNDYKICNYKVVPVTFLLLVALK